MFGASRRIVKKINPSLLKAHPRGLASATSTYATLEASWKSSLFPFYPAAYFGHILDRMSSSLPIAIVLLNRT